MNRITMLEIMMLAVTVVMSTAVLFMPYVTAQAAGQDAWISVLVAGAVALVPAWAAGVVMARFPKKSIVEALPRLLGGVLGKLVALFYLAFFLFAAILVIWQLEEFVVGSLMPETPELAIRVVFLLGVAYGAFNGATPLIRTNAYIMPVGIVVIGLVVGLPLTRMNPAYWTPVFERGLQPMLDGALLLLGWLAQIPLVVLMFNRYVEQNYLRLAPRKAMLAVFITTIAMLLGALGTLAAFGPKQTATFYYPSFAVARIISVGAFLEHIEVAFVAVWIAAMFVAASFYVQAFIEGIADITGITAKVLLYLLILPGLMVWPLFFDLDIYTLLTLIRTLAPWGAIAVGAVLPLVFLVRIVVAPPPPEKGSG